MQLFHASFGLTHPLGAFELKGLGHNTDSQHAQLARGLRDDRSRARPGAAAHASGDKAHMRAGQMIDDVLDAFFGCGSANACAGTRAQTFGDLFTQLDSAVRHVLRQRLCVGIRDDKIHAFQLLFDHVVDGVTARPAHTEHGDARFQLVLMRHRKVKCHLWSACAFCPCCPGVFA